MKIDFAREIALKVLYEVEENKEYSNIILNEYLNKNKDKLSSKDVGFISELVYGTISRKLTIDCIIQKYSKIKCKKMSAWVINILRLGVYQIIFLDKVPKSAAVNEAVNMSKKYAYKSSGFINAILRKIEKEDFEELNNIKDEKERLSKVYSMPEWLVQKLLEEYGSEKAKDILIALNLRPELTIRMNMLKSTREEFEKKLEENDIEYEETDIPTFFNVKMRNIENSELFKNGYFTVQDKSAGLTSIILNPKKGDYVLDACSAPGGKTTHLAEIMNNEGEILAWELHDIRLKLINDNAKRLGIKIINAKQNDATILNEELIQKFDKILLDVPCMGIGVIKRKTDIKWQRKVEDIEEISKIQFKILDTCSKYLKKDGEMVYSTCSILKEENENIVRRFIEKNKDFEIIEEHDILPTERNDGFYICKLKKMN